MANNSVFYFDVLYPFQDRAIQAINRADTGFYFTGGTAASRGYLQHRFSDDLDYFVNDDNRFGLWVERIIQSLNKEWKCEVMMKEERFARLNLAQKDLSLKIEMINDVPARVGDIQPAKPLLKRPGITVTPSTPRPRERCGRPWTRRSWPWIRGSCGWRARKRGGGRSINGSKKRCFYPFG